jgi:hypothetical protein
LVLVFAAEHYRRYCKVFTPANHIDVKKKGPRDEHAFVQEFVLGFQKALDLCNISDHLKLMYDDSRIAIFHHATFLKYHQNRKCQIFPAGFIEETIRTLALLFPQHDKKSCRWFKVQQSKFGLDHMVSASSHLTTEQRQIENSVFWHDRLGILKQVFGEAEPSTIAQW